MLNLIMIAHNMLLVQRKNLTTNNASILNLNNGTVTDNITIAEKVYLV